MLFEEVDDPTWGANEDIDTDLQVVALLFVINATKGKAEA
jgi:hypothetical protein